MNHKLKFYLSQVEALNGAISNHDDINNFIDSDVFINLNHAQQLQTHEIMKSLTMYIKMLKGLIQQLESDLGGVVDEGHH